MPDRGNPENPKRKPFRLGSGPRVAPPPIDREPGKPPGIARVPVNKKPAKS